jgi:diguanylate cyclase (GGDEF)-like protein
MKSIVKKLYFVILILLVAAIFMGSSVILQNQLKLWMQEQTKLDLLHQANTFTKLLHISRVGKQTAALDPFLDEFSAGSPYRFTIIDIDGTVKADSWVTTDKVYTIENHADRHEIKNIKRNAPGISIHYSTTVKTKMMYLAIPLSLQDFDGYIRVSIPMNKIDNYLSKLNNILLGIASVCSVLLIIIIVMALHVLNKINIQHHKELEDRVIRRTKDITLIQKFGQMLTACNDIEEISEVVSTTAKSMFSDSSGALSLLHPSLDYIEIITTWGDEWPGQTIYHPNDCWAFRRGSHNLSIKNDIGFSCKHISTSNPVYCVPLLAQGISIGSISVTVPTDSMNERYRKMILTFSEHISMSIANVNLKEKLEHQAVRDPLTNLFNRRYLDESLTREIQRADRRNTSIGVMMIDIDHFKNFNDTFGHEAGDYVLQKFGVIITKLVRGEDIPCRYGGEEFTLIIPEADLETTKKRAMELLDQTRKMDLIHGDKTLGSITISIGIAVFPGHGTTCDSLIRSADQALYFAKSKGRDQIQTFNQN